MSKRKNIFKTKWLQLKQVWIGWHVSRMKTKADRLRETEGSQMFVVHLNGKICIISKRWFKEQKRHGAFSKTFTIDSLKRISFYYTRG